MKEEQPRWANGRTGERRRRLASTSGEFARGCRRGGTKMVEGIKTVVLDVTYCPSGSADCPPPPRAAFPRELLFPLENSPGDERSSPPPSYRNQTFRDGRKPRLIFRLFTSSSFTFPTFRLHVGTLEIITFLRFPRRRGEKFKSTLSLVALCVRHRFACVSQGKRVWMKLVRV